MNNEAMIANYQHIQQVRTFLHDVIQNILKRSLVHDQSKLESPEKEVFEEFTDKLASSTYGSQEYEDCRKAMAPALEHHYAKNRHHPEHYRNGIKDMSLLDLVEMICDWKAATLRHNDGNILKSLEHNKQRFNFSDELYGIFLNTLKELNLV